MSGLELIAQERAEQIEKHGFSIENDVRNNRFSQLIDGAGALLLSNPKMRDIPTFWDKERWRKMKGKSYKERLIISAALIAAEIDRMQAVEDRRQAENSFKRVGKKEETI